ncbi:diguanylate cyclase (GGDEF) domain-containing protein [Blastococcus aurantiacus]|uniref:Diguanylate cyclase (GGDEF) domain-containing protein n=1 Tax=Blastococcus aurantiacus TaxID=1550231 RepID=A0A1G7N2N3_9ACTN|nr:GGDEF domain-containing protein [Blastococcus aurantiacus]SDF67570.1 diguanylate cyclase (GGDEF) domain-containing protein [Blastococcus aurantiacus]
MPPASAAAASSGPSPAELARLQAALWRLLAVGDRDDDTFRGLLDDVDDALSGAQDPYWSAWRSALAARRNLTDGEPDAAAESVAASREALHACLPSAWTALTLAYLAHVEVTADRVDAAMLMAVDASLLTEEPSAEDPSRPLLQAHRWLSLTLAGLDLEELAVAHAGRAHAVAALLPDLDDQWQTLLLSAQRHAELAQTLHRRGDEERARELAEEAIGCAIAARELDREPAPAEADLLDVVQAWALTCADDLDGALGPLRRVHRHVQGDGGLWLRGYTDLVLARLLARLAARDDDIERGEEAVGLLVDAAGAFAASGDRRRYRQCLLELGQNTADLGRPAEALHWLEAYRADTGRAHARGRELWAEMFVRRSRLREAERQAAVLRRHALEDPLTGLGNRRSAERRLAGLRFGEEPLSLAVVDVDRFKEVNDGASHTQGDVVLRRVADLLREHSRTDDEVFRWAGDEFLVLLPTATEAQAVVVMERLRAAVAAADWSDLRLTEPVTVSVGVATAPEVDEGHPEPVVGWRALFDTADLLLFSAKRSGRNRVRAPGGSAAPVPGEDDA